MRLDPASSSTPDQTPRSNDLYSNNPPIPSYLDPHKDQRPHPVPIPSSYGHKENRSEKPLQPEKTSFVYSVVSWGGVPVKWAFKKVCSVGNTLTTPVRHPIETAKRTWKAARHPVETFQNLTGIGKNNPFPPIVAAIESNAEHTHALQRDLSSFTQQVNGFIEQNRDQQRLLVETTSNDMSLKLTQDQQQRDALIQFLGEMRAEFATAQQETNAKIAQVAQHQEQGFAALQEMLTSIHVDHQTLLNTIKKTRKQNGTLQQAFTTTEQKIQHVHGILNNTMQNISEKIKELSIQVISFEKSQVQHQGSIRDSFMTTLGAIELLETQLQNALRDLSTQKNSPSQQLPQYPTYAPYTSPEVHKWFSSSSSHQSLPLMHHMETDLNSTLDLEIELQTRKKKKKPLITNEAQSETPRHLKDIQDIIRENYTLSHGSSSSSSSSRSPSPTSPHHSNTTSLFPRLNLASIVKFDTAQGDNSTRSIDDCSSQFSSPTSSPGPEQPFKQQSTTETLLQEMFPNTPLDTTADLDAASLSSRPHPNSPPPEEEMSPTESPSPEEEQPRTQKHKKTPVLA